MPDADTRQLLEHAAAVVTVLAPQTLVDVRGVAVGFDDGDFVITWQRSR